MTSYILATEARQDLIDIYLEGLERWGEVQADHYQNALHDVFAKLSVYPELGRHRPELSEQVRSFPHGSHVIFYIKSNNEIAIVRVLKGSRDIKTILQ